MLRHDRATLRTLPLRRQIAALFAGDLRAAIMSLIETALADDDFDDPRAAVIGGYNEWGDHVGHTAALAAPNRSVAGNDRAVSSRRRADQVRIRFAFWSPTSFAGPRRMACG